MNQNLRMLFERALDTEPEPPTGDLAHDAMSAGTALRRRRHLLTGGALAGVVTVVATLLALNVAPETRATRPVVAAAAPMPSAGPACDRRAGSETADVQVFLRQEVTERQRDDLRDALRSDPLVQSVTLVSREEAYARFKEAYRDNPDLVAAVRPDQFPESFRVGLARATDFSRFVAGFDHRSGVDEIVGDPCPTRSGSWGE